jgi:hypothetical protein
MSLFSSIGKLFKPIEKAIRPFVRPALAAITTAFAPGAAPLINAFLNPGGGDPPDEQPQGYFPQPPRVQMAQAPFQPWMTGGPYGFQTGFAPAIPIRSTGQLLVDAVDWGMDAYGEMQSEYDYYDVEEM